MDAVLTLKDILLNVSKNYLTEKEKKFGGNSWKDILTKKPQTVSDLTNTKLHINGSVGQGRWATIPWIVLRDPAISVSTEQGFDLVYLFSADMKEIYLSLNQGWSYFKERIAPIVKAKQSIEQVSSYLRSQIDTHGRDDLLPNIDLQHEEKFNTDLPEGYERGSIWAIRYECASLPSNDVLKSDLGYMLLLEKSLKNFIIENYSENGSLKPNFINNLIIDSAGHTIDLKQINIPAPSPASSTKKTIQHPKKIDFEKKHSKNTKIGLLGEKWVFQQEIDRLTKLGRADLANKVKIKSEISDTYHYDILSYDEFGNEIYIEVKTTTSKSDTAFYISKYELEFGHKNQQNYEIWRLLNFDENKLSAEYYILRGDPTITINAEPVTYSCTPNISNK